MKTTAMWSARVEKEQVAATLEVESAPPESAPGATPSEPTLEVVLTAAARRFPDALLAVTCAVGVLGVAVVLIFFRSVWRLALVLGILGAFGAWAIADRELTEQARHPAAWRVFKAVVGFVGMSAVFVFCLSLLAVALGMWKS